MCLEERERRAMSKTTGPGQKEKEKSTNLRSRYGIRHAHVITRIRNYTVLHGRCLNITAWAITTVGQLDEELFISLGRTAKVQTREFAAQHLANTAWALAKVGQSDG